MKNSERKQGKYIPDDKIANVVYNGSRCLKSGYEGDAVGMDKGYALIHGVILDGSREMEPQTGKVIFVEGKTITAIRNEGIDLDGYQVIDLAGQYIMPGLINLHVHIPGTGKPKKKPQDVRKLVRKVTANGLMRRLSYGLCTALVRPEVYSGVTTIRTVGGILDYDSRLRDEINAGNRAVPEKSS